MLYFTFPKLSYFVEQVRYLVLQLTNLLVTTLTKRKRDFKESIFVLVKKFRRTFSVLIKVNPDPITTDLRGLKVRQNKN